MEMEITAEKQATSHEVLSLTCVGRYGRSRKAALKCFLSVISFYGKLGLSSSAQLCFQHFTHFFVFYFWGFALECKSTDK